MVKSIAEICEDDSNKAVVEDSDGYIFYQLVFMLAYGVVCLLCSYMLGSEWKKAQKVTINNNRYVGGHVGASWPPLYRTQPAEACGGRS